MRNTGSVRHMAWLTAIVIAGAALRIYNIDFQSLWLDEIYTMKMVDPVNSVADIYRLSKTLDPLSLLYFLMVHAWVSLFHFDGASVRMFSVLMGVGGIAGVYFLGRELYSRRAGLLAAALASVNYFHISYSQEARVYSMYFLSTTLSFLYLARFVKAPTWRSAAWYGVFTLLMALSHFFSLFTLFGQAIFLFAWWWRLDKPERLRTLKLFAAPAVIGIIGYLPMIPILLTLTKVEGTWIPWLGADTLFSVYKGFFGDSFNMVVVTLFFLLSFAGLMLFSERVPGMQPRFAAMLALWVGVTVLCPFVQSFVKFPTLQARYLINVLPALLVLIACGIDRISRREVRIAVSLFVVSLSAFEVIYVNKYYEDVRKTNFREITREVVESNGAQYPVVTSLPFHFSYYLDLFGNHAYIEDGTVSTILQRFRNGERPVTPFWSMEAHGRKFEVADSLKGYLEKNFVVVRKVKMHDAEATLVAPKEDSSSAVMRIAGSALSGGVTRDEEQFLFNNGALVSGEITLPPGDFRLIVKAMGIPSAPIGGVGTHVVVQQNGSPIRSYYLGLQSYLSGDTMPLKISGELPVRLSIVFDNDTSGPNFDRNLLVRELKIMK